MIPRRGSDREVTDDALVGAIIFWLLVLGALGGLAVLSLYQALT